MYDVLYDIRLYGFWLGIRSNECVCTPTKYLPTATAYCSIYSLKKIKTCVCSHIHTYSILCVNMGCVNIGGSAPVNEHIQYMHTPYSQTPAIYLPGVHTKLNTH